MDARIKELDNKFKALDSMFKDWMKGDTNAAIKALDNKLADLSGFVNGNFADINALKKRVAANEATIEARLTRNSLNLFNPDETYEGDESDLNINETTKDDDTTEEDKDPDGSDDEDTVQRSNSLKTFNHSTTQLKI